MRRALPLAGLLAVLAGPALAQSHGDHHPAPAATPAPAADAPPPEEDAMPAMDWPTELPADDDAAAAGDMSGMDHGAHGAHGDHGTHREHGDGGAVGDEPPPPLPADHAADAVFGEAAMRPSRRILAREHGGMPAWKVTIDQAEWRGRDGDGSFGWKAEAWYGGDRHRVVVKTEGAAAGGDLGEAEAQLLYSRAVSPYFDLQAGLRHDFGEGPDRTFATVGFEGLAPYWIETEGALFLSDRGEAFARLEASYDLRLTQRLILQPAAEVGLAGQAAPELGLGSGLTDLGLDLRLRYEIRREFAPYIGVAHERRFGATADMAKAAGEDDRETRLVAGLRVWF